MKPYDGACFRNVQESERYKRLFAFEHGLLVKYSSASIRQTGIPEKDLVYWLLATGGATPSGCHSLNNFPLKLVAPP